MYIKIDLSNRELGEKEVTKEDVEKILKQAGISFETHDTPLALFSKEEAEYRLENWESENYSVLDEKLRDEILGRLKSTIEDDEYTIDSERVFDTTIDVMDSFEDELNKYAIEYNVTLDDEEALVEGE